MTTTGETDMGGFGKSMGGGSGIGSTTQRNAGMLGMLGGMGGGQGGGGMLSGLFGGGKSTGFSPESLTAQNWGYM
jgi:hypothetical protein